tara:strand:+ start:2421 stop:3275 length:855 start_codon:yes stop_codon:yes gene_type:complete
MAEIIKILVLIIFTSLIALAGSQDGFQVNGSPMIFSCLMISFAIHYLVFIPSYLFKTERYFDITGSIAFLSIMYFIINNRNLNDLNYSGIILISLIMIWTIRLGTFLFLRIHKDGNDRRFNEVKTNFLKFMFVWTMSATWVFITSCCAIAALTSNTIYDNLVLIGLGICLWLIGFLIEIISDFQKRQFRKNTSNGFISSGLWAYSRHPNYLGEIILWLGICLISIPTLNGFQYVTIISPIFVYLLLSKGTGINILEEYAEKKWGDLDEYKQYKKNTPILFPFKK